MAILYVFRRPRFPVIVLVESRVFRALSSAAIEKLLRRELKTGQEVRLLDSEWAWFKPIEGEVMAISPLIANPHPITKQALVDLVNGRANKVEGAPSYQRRSLSSRSREEVFQELLAILQSG
jgi:hypothetical protein